MKTFAFVVINTALLSACASPQEARDKGPVATYSSAKPAQLVADCVASAWESTYGVSQPVTSRVTAQGVTVQIAHQHNTMVLLDVENHQGGSTSKYFKGTVWLEGKWDKAVQECQ